MARRPQLVSLSYLLPYSGVDHAGGELLLHHYRLLAPRCTRLDAFGIAFDENREADGRDSDVRSDSYRAVIVEFPRWRKSLWGKAVALLSHLAVPVLPDIGIQAAFGSSDLIRERVQHADIVELQWFEFFHFAGLVKRINPDAKIIGFVHDIPSQKLERELSGWPRPLRRAYLSYAIWLERRTLRKLDRVTVLSEKDAQLLARRSPSTDIVVLHPPLQFDRAEVAEFHHREVGHTDDAANISFGFIGAFHRPENHDAAMWLMSEIWPSVIARCPSARLFLVGSKPSQELRDAASTHQDSVTVTGYIDDIDAYYDLFSTVVIPLRYGAGVKFKTITGILAGKNIVATPVAVEGTLTEDHFFRVSDSAVALADAMVEIIRQPRVGREVAEKARDAVGSRYSHGNYARAVADAYGLTLSAERRTP